MKLSENLVFYRKKKGLSQLDLAMLLNVSRQAISKWENDKCYPDIENMVLLTKIYKISLEDIIH